MSKTERIFQLAALAVKASAWVAIFFLVARCDASVSRDRAAVHISCIEAGGQWVVLPSACKVPE